VRSLQRPLFIGCLMTAVPMLLLDFPTGDSFPWFKRLAEILLTPGHFVMSAIMFGKLYNSSYYYSAILNIAFYTVLALVFGALRGKFA
jgi:hypothetical protein